MAKDLEKRNKTAKNSKKHSHRLLKEGLVAGLQLTGTPV
jgi:hypothetical protein